LADQTLNRAGEIRLAEFQEGRLDALERTRTGQFGGYGTNSFIGGFHPRPVTEDDEAGAHCPAPWM
jgi:hypothetical protein